ncbi:MAG: putative metal-binding motif-containing protein, partial [Myxococcales bacterium]|nr:putative metal-binding motif-containing protein [Myxococcales bacterium]
HCYLVASNLEDIEGALEAVANKVMTETCDGHDNDCDGFVDEDFDVDGDSYTTCGTRTTGGPGQPVDNGAADCDDRDGTTFPGAKEACDGRDNDCNGTSDEGCGCTFGDERPCGTAEGTCSVGRQVCEGGAWSECRDGVAPAAVEICDGLDDNCNGQIDDGAVCDAGDTCFEGVCSPIAYTGGAGCSVSAVPGPVTSTTTLLFLAGILGWLSRRRRA